MFVVKSNNLLEAKYKLSLEEQRLILYLVSLINIKDEDFKKYEINVKKFSEVVGLTKDTQYTRMKKICTSLVSKTLTIKDDNGFVVLSWLSSARYSKKEGKIKLCFDPELKPYLLQLKNNFTKYNFTNIIDLNSIYSIRLFELLKQYENLKSRVLTIEDLRNILGIESVKSYNRYNDFKRFVILPAQKELKEKCDIYFAFDEIKEGRKITKIKFYIFKNTKKEDKPKEIKPKKERLKRVERVETPSIEIEDTEIAETALNREELQVERVETPLNEVPHQVERLETPLKQEFVKALKIILNEGLSNSALKAIAEAANYDLSIIMKRYKAAQNSKKIDNLAAFMIWACKQPDEKFENVPLLGVNSSSAVNPSVEDASIRRTWDLDAIERVNLQLLIQEDKKYRGVPN